MIVRVIAVDRIRTPYVARACEDFRARLGAVTRVSEHGEQRRSGLIDLDAIEIDHMYRHRE